MNRCPICKLEVAAGSVRCPRDGALLTEPQDPMIGAMLAGRYRILARLARGGMSSVYLARHILIERVSAIKILRRDLCDDPVQRDRFLREARAVNRINHENIVEIIDYGESEDGRVFLVMEYLPGESLHERLSRGPLAPAHALDVAAQIASGLARAHQMGVIHRDLKPDNIILMAPDEDNDVERVKILDFGIAKILDQPSLTATDKIFGTPGYIAPEYAAGAPIDGRADLYSLGVVLYEMVTAQLPFDVEYPADLLIKHMLEPPIPPRERDASVPESVEQLILQSLAKDPSQRYRDAFHMLEEIERVKATLRPDDAIADTPRRSDMPPRDGTQDIIETPTSLSVPSSLSPPRPDVGGGIVGAHAWGRYLEALRNDLDSRVRVSKRPPALETHLARMDAVCGLMQDRSDRVQQLRTRMISLEARGRDFRTTIGRAIDALAGELSVKARERDAISGERDALEKDREDLMSRARDGDRDAAGRADAVLWEIAAVDEALRAAVTACEDVEYQLRELGTQLERLSESLEADQNELVTDLDTTLRRLALDDHELRTLATTLPI